MYFNSIGCMDSFKLLKEIKQTSGKSTLELLPCFITKFNIAKEEYKCWF